MFAMAMATDGSLVLRVGDRPGLLLPDVTVRPLGRMETAPVLEVFGGMSPQSRRMRFLTAVPALDDSMLRRLADVDHVVHGCWVAEVGGEAVGLGRYVALADRPGTAEVALDVVDRFQGHGLGRLLLEVVAAAARDTDVGSLYWVLDPANERIRRLAAPLGATLELHHDVLEGTSRLPELPPLDATRVARVARSARRRATTRGAA
ncbi:GNAT family N-acetyltransferase [Blastococcus deserti]|uniref:GNAT family N-acetyltransferase n=1 Tax=Blastococcus deserti TaxID=2259033 RepID=A0ABW4XFQ7_9ACTN